MDSLKSNGGHRGGGILIEIDFVWGVIITLVFYIIVIRIWMEIANYIGEKIGIGAFLTEKAVRYVRYRQK